MFQWLDVLIYYFDYICKVELWKTYSLLLGIYIGKVNTQYCWTLRDVNHWPSKYQTRAIRLRLGYFSTIECIPLNGQKYKTNDELYENVNIQLSM